MRQLIRVVCFCVVFLPFAGPLAAQDISDLISGSKADANYLMKGYVSPLMNAVGTGFNQGWYNTAKPHKKFGFDLTISVSAVAVPSSDKFFTVKNSSLSSLDLTTDHDNNQVDPATGSGKVPTIFGPGSTASTYTYRDNQPSAGEVINGIGGEIDIKDLPMQRMPVPIYNLGFGLPKEIEVKIRFMPKIGPDEAKFSFFGLGVLHDVKQYIPGLKMMPFDLSGFVGYTRMSIDAELDDADPSKKGELAINSTTIQGLISKKLSVVTFYGGVGYDFVKSNLAAKGNYDLNGDGIESADESNPIDFSVSTNGFRGTVGMRLKLAVFTFHADYAFQKYNTFTVGFGLINIR